MEEEKQSKKATAEKKRPKKGGKLYLSLKIFRVFFLTAVVVLLMIQPIINSSFVGNRLKLFLNKKYQNAFHWSSYHISLIKREITVNDFALVERGDTLTAAEKIVLQIRPLPLLNNTLKITKAELYTPIVTFHIDSNGTNGYSRLFITDPPKEKEDKEPLKLLLRGVQVTNGSLAFSHAKQGINASLRNLDTKLYYNSEFKDCDLDLQFTGLHYSDPVRSFDFDTLSLFLEMIEGNVTESELFVSNDSSALSLSGDVTAPFSIAEAGGNLSFDVTMPMGILQNITGDSTCGSGVLTLKGTQKGSFNRPTLDLDATFRGRDFFYSPITSVDLSLTLDTMQAEITKGNATFGSGELFVVTGGISIAEIFPLGFFGGYVHSGLHKMSWRADAKASHAPDTHSLYKNYTVSAKGRGVGVLPDSMASSLSVKGESDLLIEGKATSLALHTSVDFTRKELKIKKATLYESESEVLSFSGGVNVFTQVIDLTCIMDSLRLETLLPSFLNIPAKGVVHSTVTAKGAMTSPDLSVVFRGDNLAYDAIPLGAIDAQLRYESKKGGVFCHLDQKMDNNRVTFKTEGVLFQPESFTLLKNPTLSLTFDLRADLASFVEKGIAGQVSAKGAYSGNLEKGSGAITLISDSIITPFFSMEKIALSSTVKDGVLHISKGAFELPRAGSLSLSGWINKELEGDLSLRAKEVLLDSLPYVADLKLSGRVGVNAQVSGSMTDPTLSLTGMVHNFAYDTYTLQNPILCTLSFANDSVDLITHNEKSTLRAGYGVSSGLYNAEAALRDFALDELFSYLSLDRLNGDLTAICTVKGRGSEVREGRLQVDSIVLFDGLKRIVSGDSLALSYNSGKTTVDTMALSFNDSSAISLSGSITDSGHVALGLKGDLPLFNLASFVPELAQPKGSISMNLTLNGSLQDIKPAGTVFLNDLGATLLSTDQEIKKVSGSVSFARSGIIKPLIETELGESGYILVDGFLQLDSMLLSKGDLDISLYKVPVVVPDMADIVLGGALSYDIQKEKVPRLSGALELIEGYYYQDIKLIPDLTTRKRKGLNMADSTKPLLDLDVKLLPKGNLIVDNNLAYLEIAPDIQVKGSERKTILEGRAEVENGEISYLNTRFEVDKGRIDFVNPERIQMDVNILAHATIRHYIITLTLTGDPESNLDFRLSGVDSLGSTVNDEDVLSIALTGYTMEELSVTGDEAIKKLLSAFVNNQIDESNFKMIDRVTYEYLGENSNKFTFGEDLTRRLSTDVILEFSDGTAKQKALFNFKVQDNVSINSFIDSEDNSGGEVGFEFKRR